LLADREAPETPEMGVSVKAVVAAAVLETAELQLLLL